MSQRADREWPVARRFASDGDEPWDRRFGEPPRAYRSFLFFKDAGPERSVTGACRKFNQMASRAGVPEGPSRESAARWHTWSSKWEWHRRALAWDDNIARQTQRALEQTKLAEAQKLAAREMEEREQAWGDYQAMRQTGLIYMHASVRKETVLEDGVKVTRYVPDSDRHNALIGGRLVKDAHEMAAQMLESGRRWVSEQNEAAAHDGSLDAIIENARAELAEWRKSRQSDRENTTSAQLMPPTSSTPTP